MRESKIEDYLKQKIRAEGGEVRKVKWIGRNGAPDRVVMLKGQVCFIELKAPGKKPEPHQKREHKRMRDMGAMVLVIDSREQVDSFVGMCRGGLSQYAIEKVFEGYDLKPLPTRGELVDTTV